METKKRFVQMKNVRAWARSYESATAKTMKKKERFLHGLGITDLQETLHDTIIQEQLQSAASKRSSKKNLSKNLSSLEKMSTLDKNALEKIIPSPSPYKSKEFSPEKLNFTRNGSSLSQVNFGLFSNF